MRSAYPLPVLALLVCAACGWSGSHAPTSAPPATSGPPAISSPPPATSSPPPASGPPAGPSLSSLIGQRLVIAFKGTTPDPALLARIRAGTLGGVILFGHNIVSPAQVKALTSTLQGAARAGGQPPLLICTDQEGGIVKRLPWAPPTLTPAQLGGLPPAQARSQGAATGRALRAVGIDADLAPVADVPSAPAAFIARQGRAYSSDPATAAARVVAFGQGLGAARVAATVKHFPGLGMATRTTDRVQVTIPATAAELQPGLLPFRDAIGAGLPMVMVSNATYPAYGPRPAAWSQNIIGNLLRGQLGFDGVVITDSLDAAASVRGWSTAAAAERSAASGADLLLITGSEPTSQDVYERLVADAGDGTLTPASLRQSYDRILALKRRLG